MHSTAMPKDQIAAGTRSAPREARAYLKTSPKRTLKFHRGIVAGHAQLREIERFRWDGGLQPVLVVVFICEGLRLGLCIQRDA